MADPTRAVAAGLAAAVAWVRREHACSRGVPREDATHVESVAPAA